MQAYIIRRLLIVVPLLLLISFITFSIMHLAPGGMSAVFIGERVRSEEDRQAIAKYYGLDQPFHLRYLHWMRRTLQGDLGHSLKYRRPVLQMIVERIPATLQLTIPAVLVSVMVAIPVGVISAVRQYSAADNVATAGAFIFVSMPTFLLGMISIIVFSVHLKWLPISGMSSYGLRDPALLTLFIDRIRHIIIPGAIVLGLGFTASLLRYVRASMLEVLRQDYIRTARAKGIAERLVIYKHALRNSLLPVVTILGLWVPFILGGSMIAEVISAWPGMGRLAVDAVFSRDYPVVMGTLLISAMMTLLGSLLADVTYAFLDPRIRYD